MNASEAVSIAITDTSILINLSHTGHLSLLGQTLGFRFVIPDEVLAEVTDQHQILIVEGALREGAIARESINSPFELELFAQLTEVLGSGESACLALAESRGWLVACDEKRVFLREALTRLGAGRILNTPGLYVLWIRTGVLSVADADAAKLVLEANRFKMGFSSFGDVV